MDKIFLTVLLMIVLAVMSVTSWAAPKPVPGEEAFVKNCGICHTDGGNIINPAKTLKWKDLNTNGLRTPADIVKNMRNPGPGMMRFDEETIPDSVATQIAEYILKTFK